MSFAERFYRHKHFFIISRKILHIFYHFFNRRSFSDWFFLVLLILMKKIFIVQEVTDKAKKKFYQRFNFSYFSLLTMITSNYILFACICWNCMCLLQIRWTLSACVYCILALHVFTADTLWRLHVVLVLACNHGQLTSGCDSSAGQRWASCPGPSWPNIPHQFDHQILLLAAVETTMSPPKKWNDSHILYGICNCGWN